MQSAFISFPSHIYGQYYINYALSAIGPVSQFVLSIKESLLVLKKKQGDRLLHSPPSLCAAGNAISCCQELMQMRGKNHGDGEKVILFLVEITQEVKVTM